MYFPFLRLLCFLCSVPLFPFVFDLFQQFLNADGLLHCFVIIEGQFRNASEVVQAFAERTANERGGRSQTFESFFSLAGISEHSDENSAIAQVGRDLHCGYGGQTDARILNLTLNNFAELHAHLFFDSIDPSPLHFPKLGQTISMLL